MTIHDRTPPGLAAALNAGAPPRTPWLLTQSGRAVHVDADERSISVRDIANHLAKINRFVGATIAPYSVAQHSVLVAEIVHATTRSAKLALYGLFHDAHEAYIGDVARPVKVALKAALGVDPIAALAERLDVAIHATIGLPWPCIDAHLVNAADECALATELRDLLPEPPKGYAIDGLPAAWRARIKPMRWDRAEEAFLGAYADLAALAGVALAR